MRRSVVILAGLAACGADSTVITPIVDVPANDTASAFPLDSITVSAAHAGAAVDITSATFTKGQTVALGGIPYGDDLVLHMTGRVGTSDIAYGRTCAFALDQNGTPPEPHLYFARTVKFGQLGFVPELRVGGTSVTYHDGSGILIGGASPDDPAAAVTDVERFDPSTGTYGPLTTIANRVGSVVALLGLGTEAHVTVLGGMDPTTGQGATFVETIEADNPMDRRVERIDDSSLARVGLTATTLTTGDVLVMGGSGEGSGSGSGMDPAQTVQEITLTAGTPSVRPAHSNLLHGRWNHTATRLGDDTGAPVLVAGGLGSDNGTAPEAPVAEAELFNPLTEKLVEFPGGNPTMVVPRWGHRAVRMLDGSVLIVGGLTRDAMGNPIGVHQLELFEPLPGNFVAPPTAVLPGNAGVIDFALTTLPDGRVLLTGGRAEPGGPPVATAYILQINTDTGSVDILATDHMAVPRAGHGATPLCDGTVLISGGTTDPAPAERYNPPALDRR